MELMMANSQQQARRILKSKRLPREMTPIPPHKVIPDCWTTSASTTERLKPPKLPNFMPTLAAHHLPQRGTPLPLLHHQTSPLPPSPQTKSTSRGPQVPTTRE